METDPSPSKTSQEPQSVPLSFHRIMLKAKYSFYSAVFFIAQDNAYDTVDTSCRMEFHLFC